MEGNRYCRLCDILGDISGDAKKEIAEYILRIKEEDRVDDEIYNKRLDICIACDKLSGLTCLACGCYAEIRAAAKQGSCPKKKWK